MAKRPDSHITGSKAVHHILDNLIPEEWVSNETQLDYGLDLFVEIVTNNQTTGNHFFIQSKGTKEDMVDGKITYSLSMERIIDYNKMVLPILLVYYSTSRQTFWGRWMNAVYDTLTETEKKKQSISLVFTELNEIDTTYLRKIGPFVSMELTRQIAVDVATIPTAFIGFNKQIEFLCTQYLKESIEFRAPLSPERILVDYQGDLETGNISIKSEQLEIKTVAHDVDSTFQYMLNPNWQMTPPVAQNVILSLALYASKIATKSQGFILNFITPSFIKIVPTQFWQYFMMSMQIDGSTNLSKFLQSCIDAGNQDIITSVEARLFLESKAECKTPYRYLLQELLKVETDNQQKGHLCYNLANNLRTTDIRKSAELYLAAIRYFPTYRACFYWWQEFAGVLFLTHHYLFAELFYKKAREINKTACRQDLSLLIADCLLWQGKYEEAFSEINQQIDIGMSTENQLSANLNLKLIIAGQLIKEAKKTFRNMDWFNEGVSFSQGGNYLKALDSFLYAWLFDNRDIEAMSNAFICAVNSKEDIMGAQIILAMKEQYGIDAYNSIVSTLVTKNMDVDKKNILERLKQFFITDEKTNLTE